LLHPWLVPTQPPPSPLPLALFSCSPAEPSEQACPCPWWGPELGLAQHRFSHLYPGLPQHLGSASCPEMGHVGSPSLMWLFPSRRAQLRGRVDRKGNSSATWICFITVAVSLLSLLLFHPLFLPHFPPRTFPSFPTPSSFLTPISHHLLRVPPTSWPCSRRRVPAHSTRQQPALTCRTTYSMPRHLLCTPAAGVGPPHSG